MILFLVCSVVLLALLAAGIHFRKRNPDVSLTYFGVAIMDVISGIYLYFSPGS